MVLIAANPGCDRQPAARLQSLQPVEAVALDEAVLVDDLTGDVQRVYRPQFVGFVCALAAVGGVGLWILAGPAPCRQTHHVGGCRVVGCGYGGGRVEHLRNGPFGSAAAGGQQ